MCWECEFVLFEESENSNSTGCMWEALFDDVVNLKLLEWAFMHLRSFMVIEKLIK